MCWEHIGCAWNIFLSHSNMSGLTRLCLYINGSCLDTSHIWIQYVCACVVHVWGYFEMTWSSKGFVWISLDVLGTFVKHVSDKSGLCLDITEMIEHAWKISDMYQHARNISGYFWKDRRSLKHVQASYGNSLTSLNLYGTSLDSCVPCWVISGACMKKCVNISGISLDMSVTHLDMSQDILNMSWLVRTNFTVDLFL